MQLYEQSKVYTKSDVQEQCKHNKTFYSN